MELKNQELAHITLPSAFVAVVDFENEPSERKRTAIRLLLNWDIHLPDCVAAEAACMTCKRIAKILIGGADIERLKSDEYIESLEQSCLHELSRECLHVRQTSKRIAMRGPHHIDFLNEVRFGVKTYGANDLVGGGKSG